jgi:penicillin-binding protein 1C
MCKRIVRIAVTCVLGVIGVCFLFFVCRLFISRPPLLDGIDFSQAVFDEQHHLLRITLSSDDKYRLHTPLDQISPLIVQATLLQEDQYFFQHPGVNPIAMIKAAWQTYVLNTRQFGASTITMQVARIRYGIHSKEMSGKLWQILKALQLELFYSKNEILEAYLNLASYGSNIEGIGAASTIYFNKQASQLNLAEALRLSVVPQNPRRRLPASPLQDDLHKAYHRLFQRWVEHHPEDNVNKNLLKLPLQLTKKNLPFLAPHFVDRILRIHHQKKVRTTINLQLQTLLENMVRQYLEQQKMIGINNAAAMLVDARNMEVKALIGSGDYFDASIGGQINGTRAKRSPGSTLKPFIYALALDQGIIHPYTVLKDAPTSFRDYNPENFDNDFLGPIKAKEALILSRNIPAIYLAEQLKNPSLYQLIQQAHVSRLKPEQTYGLSLALGSAEVTMEELVALYAMLANQGVWKPLRTVMEQPVIEGERLLSPEASFLTLDMLCDTPRPYAVNEALNKQLHVYWKTGTSSGYRDAWSVGVFGPYVLGLWIGNFNSQSNPSFIGTTAAAPLFFNIIEAVYRHLVEIAHLDYAKAPGLNDRIQPTPQMNLTKVQVCEASGLIPTSCCPHTVSTWFIPGKSPIKTDDVHREIAVDPKTGYRTCCFDQDTQFVVYEFWPSDILNIFAQAGVQRLTPPPFDPAFSLIGNMGGDPPHITSPQQGLFYTVRHDSTDNPILFFATADADVTTLYWFLNDEFIGSSERDRSLVWQAKSGTYVVRVVDNYGRTAVRNLVVKPVD